MNINNIQFENISEYKYKYYSAFKERTKKIIDIFSLRKPLPDKKTELDKVNSAKLVAS